MKPKQIKEIELLQWPLLIIFCMLLSGFSACAPRIAGTSQDSSKLMPAALTTADSGLTFDLRNEVHYPATNSDGCSPNRPLTDRELTMLRCTWCHGCGFGRDFDVKHYNKKHWQPEYRGQQWAPVVERMRLLESSCLNRALSARILNFLSQSTLGTYDEAMDNRGQPNVP